MLVRIFVRCDEAHPILTYFDLVDSPGISDTNIFRVKTSEKALDKCDMRIIVGNVSDRPLDNTSMWDQLKRAFEHLNLGTDKIFLVCTHAEVFLPYRA